MGKVLRNDENPKQSSIFKLSTKEFVYILTAVVVVVCMLFSWLSIDVNLGFTQLNNVLGEITIFNLPNAIDGVKNIVGVFAGFVSADVIDNLSAVHFFSVVLEIMGICVVILYIVSVALRIAWNKTAGTISRIAAVCAVIIPIMFAVLIGCILSAVDAAGYLMDALTFPWWLTMISAIISFCSARSARGSEREERVRVYTKMYGKKIEDYPHDPSTQWVCSSCGTVNKHETNLCKCGCGVALK